MCRTATATARPARILAGGRALRAFGERPRSIRTTSQPGKDDRHFISRAPFARKSKSKRHETHHTGKVQLALEETEIFVRVVVLVNASKTSKRRTGLRVVTWHLPWPGACARANARGQIGHTPAACAQHAPCSGARWRGCAHQLSIRNDIHHDGLGQARACFEDIATCHVPSVGAPLRAALASGRVNISTRYIKTLWMRLLPTAPLRCDRGTAPRRAQPPVTAARRAARRRRQQQSKRIGFPSSDRHAGEGLGRGNGELHAGRRTGAGASACRADTRCAAHAHAHHSDACVCARELQRPGSTEQGACADMKLSRGLTVRARSNHLRAVRVPSMAVAQKQQAGGRIALACSLPSRSVADRAHFILVSL